MVNKRRNVREDEDDHGHRRIERAEHAKDVSPRTPGLRPWDPDERHLWRREWDPGNYGGLDRESGPGNWPPSGRDQPRDSFRGMGPMNYTRSDHRIFEDLCDRLTEADDIDATDIKVQVEAGVVSLKGSVTSRTEKQAAEDLVRGCRGVSEVLSQLRIGSRH